MSLRYYDEPMSDNEARLNAIFVALGVEDAFVDWLERNLSGRELGYITYHGVDDLYSEWLGDRMAR